MTIQVQGYRWSQFLQRLFLARGGAGGVGQVVLDDILPVVELTDPGDAENRRPRGEDFFSVFANGGQAAGAHSRAYFTNAAGSGLLAVVTGIQAWADLANAPLWSYPWNGAVLAVLGGTNANLMDLRAPAGANNGTSLIGSSTGDTVFPIAQTAQTYGFAATAQTPVELLSTGEAYVVPPGRSIYVGCTLVTAQAKAIFTGYYRAAEPLELI